MQAQIGVHIQVHVVHVHVVAVVQAPFSVAYHRLLGEEAHINHIFVQLGIEAHTIALLPLDVALLHQEIHSGAKHTTMNIHCGELIPRAGLVSHVYGESQIFILVFSGMDSECVDLSGAIEQGTDGTVDVDSGVVSHTHRGILEIDVVLARISLNQAIIAHIERQIERRQSPLQRVDVDPLLIHLHHGYIGTAFESRK